MNRFEGVSFHPKSGCLAVASTYPKDRRLSKLTWTAVVCAHTPAATCRCPSRGNSLPGSRRPGSGADPFRIEFLHGPRPGNQSIRSRAAHPRGARSATKAVGRSSQQPSNLRTPPLDLPRCTRDVERDRRLGTDPATAAGSGQSTGRRVDRLRVLTGPQRCGRQRTGNQQREASRTRRLQRLAAV